MKLFWIWRIFWRRFWCPNLGLRQALKRKSSAANAKATRLRASVAYNLASKKRVPTMSGQSHTRVAPSKYTMETWMKFHWQPQKLNVTFSGRMPKAVYTPAIDFNPTEIFHSSRHTTHSLHHQNFQVSSLTVGQILNIGWKNMPSTIATFRPT